MRSSVFKGGRRFLLGRNARGMVLLEVIVSLVILGISVATLMRSFTISMTAIRKNDVMTQACLLAESLVQEFEINPPKTKTARGNFEEMGYPKFFWSMELKEEEIKYRNLKTKSRIDNLRELQKMKLTITYDDGRLKKFSPINMELYMMPIERYTFRSKFLNELFLEEKRR